MKKCIRRISVLQIAPSMGVHGGIEAFNITIANSLRESRSVTVSILYRLRNRCPVTQQFLDLIKNRPYPIYLLRKNPLKLLIRIFNADITHCHYPFWWVFLICLILKKPVIVTVHNKLPLKHRLLISLERRFLLSANKVLFNSQYTASGWKIACDGSRRIVVPSPTEFNPVRTGPDQRRGFVALARLVPGKGLPELIQAYQDAKLDHIRHPLLILGTGILLDELRQLIKPEHRKNITLYGYVEESQKALFLSKALWNVAPQTLAEDLGLSPIEAGLCGVPSIISNLGGLPEAGGPGAIHVMPGDLESLRDALEKASTMSCDEYSRRCRENEEYLKRYLVPFSFYETIYEDVSVE